MSSSITVVRLLAVALFALSGEAAVAQVEAGKPVDVKSAAAAAAKEKTTTAAKEKATTAAKEKAAAATKEKARKGTASDRDVKKLVDQLSAERDTLIADHAELVKQLK